jgi:hypothetical protein
MTSRESQSIGSQWGTDPEFAEPIASFKVPEFKQVTKSVGQHGNLAEELHKKGYHPIMLFGTRAAGKSSLLASLFYYLQSDPESPAIAVRGEWIIPTETSYGKSVADAATRFLNHVVDDFYNGVAAPMTQDENPFYIPVILRPNNGQPEVKLAFLESRGEWYKVEKNSNDFYPELRAEVSDVYKNFPNGISILLIAPYVIGEAYSDQVSSEWARSEMRDSDTALFGALQAYQMAREHRELDKYLFVLTKWDAHTHSIVEKEFINPPRGMVSHLLKERFPKSWTLFQTMQSSEAQSMQYSSGLMSGNARVEIPQHLKPIMNQFPKMLWRWLYSNSTGGAELFHSQFPESNATSVVSKMGVVGLLRKLLG